MTEYKRHIKILYAKVPTLLYCYITINTICTQQMSTVMDIRCLNQMI